MAMQRSSKNTPVILWRVELVCGCERSLRVCTFERYGVGVKLWSAACASTERYALRDPSPLSKSEQRETAKTQDRTAESMDEILLAAGTKVSGSASAIHVNPSAALPPRTDRDPPFGAPKLGPLSPPFLSLSPSVLKLGELCAAALKMPVCPRAGAEHGMHH